MRHVNIKVHGRVQGVLYRSSGQNEAIRLGLTGFARNEPDGTVYFEAEGDEEGLKKFLDWCCRGPRFAKVERVDYNFNDKLKKFSKFNIF